MPSTGTLHKCWRRPFTVKTCLDPWAESKLLTIISTGDFQVCHSAPFNTSIFPLASSADRKRDAHKRRGTQVQAAEKKAAWEIGLRNENSPRDRHWKSTARDMGTARGKAGGGSRDKHEPSQKKTKPLKGDAFSRGTSDGDNARMRTGTGNL